MDAMNEIARRERVLNRVLTAALLALAGSLVAAAAILYL
jgi:hypothetical protein